VICDVQRIDTEPDVMPLAFSMLGAKKRNAEFTIELHVQREKGAKRCRVGHPHIVCSVLTLE